MASRPNVASPKEFLTASRDMTTVPSSPTTTARWSGSGSIQGLPLWMVVNGALLSTASGLLHVTLLPPFSWHWLAWVVLVPLLWCLTRVNVALGAAFGAIFGFQMAAAIYWWFPDMLVDFFHLPFLVAWVAAVISGIVVAMPYAGFGAWVAHLSADSKATPVLIAAGWVLAEFVSARWLVPNRFGLLAHTQIGTVWSQSVALVGQYGLGFLIVLVNGVIVGFLTSRSSKPVVRATSLGAIVLTLSIYTYGNRTSGEEYGEGDDVWVAVLQGGSELEWDQPPSRRFESFERYRNLTESVTAADPTIDLVFWPEWAAGTYLGDASEEALFHLKRLSSFGPEMVVGAPHREFLEGRKLFFNSVFLVRRGLIEGRYDKQRLIPFAESDPLDSLGGVLNRPTYSAGSDASLLTSSSGSIGVLICSESSNPFQARDMVGIGAEFLVNPSNDYWLGRREPARWQLGIVRLRAIESRRFVVRPTSTGFSAVINPRGQVLQESLVNRSEVIVSKIRKVSETSIYQRIGELVVWLAGGLVGCQMLTSWIGRRRTGTNGASKNSDWAI